MLGTADISGLFHKGTIAETMLSDWGTVLQPRPAVVTALEWLQVESEGNKYNNDILTTRRANRTPRGAFHTHLPTL